MSASGLNVHSEQQFITVASFDATMDVALVEVEFRARAIEYRLLDNNTVLVAPHLAGAIGGIRFQVLEQQVEEAVRTLTELGIRVERHHQGSPLLEWFNQRTARLPFVGLVRVEKRLVLMSVSVLLLLVPVLFLAFRTPLKDRITEVEWCVDSILIDDEAIPVLTTADAGTFQLALSGCGEAIRFSRSGEVRFPGSNGPEVRLTWRTDGSHITLLCGSVDGCRFSGEYDVDVIGTTLHLSGSRIDLRAHAWHWDTGL